MDLQTRRIEVGAIVAGRCQECTEEVCIQIASTLVVENCDTFWALLECFVQILELDKAIVHSVHLHGAYADTLGVRMHKPFVPEDLGEFVTGLMMMRFRDKIVRGGQLNEVRKANSPRLQTLSTKPVRRLKGVCLIHLVLSLCIWYWVTSYGMRMRSCRHV